MESSSIDLTYLASFCKDDRSRMARYVSMYLQGSPALYADLVSKLEAGDREGLAVAAHSLRPQVNYMGARHLFDLLTGIETTSREQGTDACVKAVQDCLRLNDGVVAELTAWSAGT